jgi:hypothetical protein
MSLSETHQYSSLTIETGTALATELFFSELYQIITGMFPVHDS